jgi:hypothetical protein
MNSFDVMSSSAKAYQLVWLEKAYIFKLAIVPVAVKIFCIALIMSFGWEDEYIRQVLIMLPAYFTEGWLLSHLVRLIYFGQRWPFRPTGDREDDERVINYRARGILSGSIFYVLIQFLHDGIVASLQIYKESTGESLLSQTEGDPSLGVLFLAILLMVLTIWAFRFLWLFIPAAANYSIRIFLHKVVGFITYFKLIAVWVICAIPLLFIFSAGSSQMLASMGVDISSVPTDIGFILNIFQSIVVTIISIIATCGISYALKEILPNISQIDTVPADKN